MTLNRRTLLGAAGASPLIWTVAFPALSMGIYAYPPPDGARVAVRTVAEHLRGTTQITLARFVLFSEETYDLFADALTEIA